MDTYNDLKMGEKGAWFSIIAYICLSALKLIVGYFGNSEALKADGLNNSTDVVASIAILIGLKISRKPPDDDHHYGHLRAESISSLIAAFIMILVGIQVLFQATISITTKEQLAPNMLTAWTALFSAFVMYIVYRYNLKLANQINSSSLKAAAYDNRSDALVSIGAFIGIIGSLIGLPWLDPLTAIIVGMIICKTAVVIFKDAAFLLTDGFDNKTLISISKIISEIPEVRSINNIRGRTHGKYLFVDVTISVDPQLNVVESHEITEEIENQVQLQHRNSYVHVHIEPYQQEFK
ncbi:cation transporter [Bacillus aquiflavi]|uniref:Cation transporter n=1 Tax=Bacillus aquiflavi TaxID=2672567 RepID=A0A6B3VVZ7_9BACI|nr:cation diffusion facilitator family transporter [Bacillus aquiflavi]MBA4535617.1 cation transporter [Bacillus aquiflavi]NEY79993.1 cation transporter [Bacillus aquiflavi]UAC48933.1 cation diffusion facilitator family transporter [Bacillus aquiflavi]